MSANTRDILLGNKIREMKIDRRKQKKIIIFNVTDKTKQKHNISTEYSGRIRRGLVVGI